MSDIYHELLEIPLYDYVDERRDTAEGEVSVRSQMEESAYRRYNQGEFPTIVDRCVECHESIWSDQGHVYTDEGDEFFRSIYHDDCYKKGFKITGKVPRTAKLKLETVNDDNTDED